MEYSFWEQIANIPWSFYAFVLIILYSLYRTTKPAIIPVRLLLFIPAFCALLTSLYFLTTKNSLLGLTLSWLPGLAVGISMRTLLNKSQQIKAIKGKNQLYLSGSWSTIILLAMIITIEGLLKTLSASHPAWQGKHLFDYSWFFIYGFFAGLFIGRVAHALRCLKYGPFIEENEAKV